MNAHFLPKDSQMHILELHFLITKFLKDTEFKQIKTIYL
jgi:hypothetical protein